MSGESDLQEALGSGEALRYQVPLRDGGKVGLTDERLLIDDGEPRSVDFENLEEITVQQLDWFLVVLGVLIVGFGLYSIDRSVLLGLAFVLAGLVSLYRTYSKRGEALIQVHGRGKPLRLFPEDLDGFQSATQQALEQRQAVLDAAAEPTD